ncbi:competence system putative prepilin ComGE [Streptococcus zalophi]|uniref:competence system putative prepilin ComGE n=1 Tax=Streptococcus zalophi TaxID=640031 RepID=UPI00215C4800|nr:competence system putative prepilin ComGE [Streptococcus zalophi]MCR8968235.1 competence system putative prepilin ComGE [Streptococcus zalophi]
MENIKKTLKAYILLESLITLALLVMVTTVILEELSKDKSQYIFKQGQTSYEKTEENISVQVHLTNQKEFSYTFFASSLEEDQKTK